MKCSAKRRMPTIGPRPGELGTEYPADGVAVLKRFSFAISAAYTRRRFWCVSINRGHFTIQPVLLLCQFAPGHLHTMKPLSRRLIVGGQGKLSAVLGV